MVQNNFLAGEWQSDFWKRIVLCGINKMKEDWSQVNYLKCCWFHPGKKDESQNSCGKKEKRKGEMANITEIELARYGYWEW